MPLKGGFRVPEIDFYSKEHTEVFEKAPNLIKKKSDKVAKVTGVPVQFCSFFLLIAHQLSLAGETLEICLDDRKIPITLDGVMEFAAWVLIPVCYWILSEDVQTGSERFSRVIALVNWLSDEFKACPTVAKHLPKTLEVIISLVGKLPKGMQDRFQSICHILENC